MRNREVKHLMLLSDRAEVERARENYLWLASLHVQPLSNRERVRAMQRVSDALPTLRILAVI